MTIFINNKSFCTGMQEIKLDLKDRKILLALDMDARKPDTQIAKDVGLSKQVTNYRIKRLEEKEIIKSYFPVINHLKLGLKLYKICLKIENVDNEKEKEIIKYLTQHASWIVTILGPWDIAFGIYAKDEYDFMEFWNKFYDKYGYYVEDRWISLMTIFWNFERSFIFPKKKNRKKMFVLGKSSSVKKLDMIDKKIIIELTKNARQTSLELAKKIKLTERIVRYRIKRLESLKIILGYRPFIDIKSLGLKYYKILINLKNASGKDFIRIRSYVTQSPNVAYSTEALGGYDFELEINFHDSIELFAFITNLKETFPTLIKNVETMEYIEEYKMTYYPTSSI